MKNKKRIARTLRIAAIAFTLGTLLLTCIGPTGPDAPEGTTPPPSGSELEVPGTPQNLSLASDGNGNTTLSWDPVASADSYRVYRSKDDTGYAVLGSTTGTSLLLANYGWYKVSALNQAGEGALSAAKERPEPPEEERTATPRFTVEPGSYDEPQSVGISCDTSGASIYYTTDGSTPVVGESPVFSSAIDIASGETVIITAIAAAVGLGNSDAALGTFRVRAWETVGSAGFSGGEVYDLALVVDGNGFPIVSFRDGSVADKATVMRFDGSSWSTLGSAGLSVQRAFYTDLASDSTGSLYLSYFDENTGGKATVQKFMGSSWTILGDDGFSGGTFLHSSLAVHESGETRIPFVAFQDGGSANKLTVMKYDGTWSYVGSAGITEGTVEYVSLAADSNGALYVAFRNGSLSGKLTVLKYDTDWEEVGSESCSSGGASYINMVLSKDGIPYVAFKDGANANKATVLQFVSGGWFPVGGEGVSASSAEYVSLGLGENDAVYLAYSDGDQDGKATLLKWGGDSWSTVGTPGISQGLAGFVCLSVGGSGAPYVAYKDESLSGRVTVKVYR